ncbi:MAG: hypothetical protein NVSMB60_10190 [Mycobacterium sp.]
MLETNPLTTVVGFGVLGALVTVSEASEGDSGVTDRAVTSCVGPADTGGSLSGLVLTTPEVLTDELGASKVDLTKVCDPDLVRLLDVIAPPELCTILLRESAEVLEPDPLVAVFAPPDARTIPDTMSCTIAEAVVDNECDGPGLEVECGLDEAVSEPVSANAAPVVLAMPKPTPIATARAPTRPILRAHPIVHHPSPKV